MKKKILTILQYAIFFGLGIFLVWWSIKDLSDEDKNHIKTALRHARYFLIIPVFFILLSSHIIRAARWKLLIGSLGYKPKTYNTFFAVMVGYLTNQAVPRLGEIVKCTLLAQYEKVPADKLIGTIILERIIDALTLVVILAITLAIQPDIYTDLVNAFFRSPHDPAKKKISGWIIAAVVIGIISLFIILWMMIKKKKISDVLLLFKKIMRSIWQGVSAIQHLKKRGLFIFYTIALWFLYFIGGYVGFYALQETEQYGVKEAFSVLSAGSIGMIATPGGIGAYAVLIEKTMELYGLQKGIALAFGWILWLATTGVILIGGLISFVLMPYFNKRKNNFEKS
jgi:uncharacterized protein (TIRG00374 family)